ncbi:hypothetical protein HII12_000514 [Brettanomyces bruxellensis]|uniref:Amino acid permease/ SLC12A domain-containing protein n=1 Tax=Dekkera bruxellensis TaxID=5007 RepID=A0A8H6EZH5_DEKBR|nr:hypothetical protein HII12_000514 [Brettanomyces bruxellensis]
MNEKLQKDLEVSSTIQKVETPSESTILDSPRDPCEKGSSTLQTTEVKRQVKRGLASRHVTMLALGGTIGSGLFIGTSTPLHEAGPVNALIAYFFFGILMFSVTQSLGEMATHTPVTGSFCVFNTRYISKSIGMATNWLYWFQWPITCAVELFAISEIMKYWTDAVPNWAWMIMFYVFLSCINLFPVRYYGEIEYWVALVKIIAIIGFIIYAFCMVCGAGKTGPVGFRYWRHPGPWGAGAGLNSYILHSHIVFVGLLVPYNDPDLTDDTTFISSSPFLISIKNSGTPVLPHILNAVMLFTVTSAGNSDVYIGSRVLYAMAGTTAPRFFRITTKQGVPFIGVLVTSSLGLLCFLKMTNSGQSVFTWLLDISATASVIDWIFVSGAHLRFMSILKSRGISRDTLPYKAFGMPFLAWFAFIALIIIIFIQGYAVFFNFKASDFFANYISLMLFCVIWIGSQLTIYRKDPWLIPLTDVDIDSGARIVDEEIMEDDVDDESKITNPKGWKEHSRYYLKKAMDFIN